MRLLLISQFCASAENRTRKLAHDADSPGTAIGHAPMEGALFYAQDDRGGRLAWPNKARIVRRAVRASAGAERARVHVLLEGFAFPWVTIDVLPEDGTVEREIPVGCDATLEWASGDSCVTYVETLDLPQYSGAVGRRSIGRFDDLESSTARSLADIVSAELGDEQ